VIEAWIVSSGPSRPTARSARLTWSREKV
jgi:hypothetical protein